MFATEEDFRRAPVGHAFMEACATCGNMTGTVILKKRGPAKNAGGLSIPQCIVPSKDTRCEYCQFLGMFFASEKIDRIDGKKWGAAKLVTEDESGIRTLLAYVPFNDGEEMTKELSDGTEFEFRHGMVIRCVKEDGNISLEKIVEDGV